MESFSIKFNIPSYGIVYCDDDVWGNSEDGGFIMFLCRHALGDFLLK